MEKEKTTYLLRDVDKSLWGKVKTKSYSKGMTIRDFILQTLKEATKDVKTK